MIMFFAKIQAFFLFIKNWQEERDSDWLVALNTFLMVVFKYASQRF